MKKILITCFAGICLTVFSTAWADVKIGILNMQDLLQNLPEMKAIGDNLKKDFADKESKIKSAQAAFKKDYEDFNRNVATITEKGKQAATQRLVQEEQNLKQLQMGFQRDYVAAQSKQVNVLLDKVKAKVAQVAKSSGYDYVLLAEVAPYAPDGTDITGAVRSAFGQK